MRFAPKSVRRNLANPALPNVRMEAVENSRHFIMYDQPERLNALIDRFFDDEN